MISIDYTYQMGHDVRENC